MISQWRKSLSFLLPPGWAFPRNPNSVVQRIVGAIARMFYDQKEWSDEVVRQGYPQHTCTRLEDWETDMGLPDCPNAPTDYDSRRAAVITKITWPYAYLEYDDSSAAALGTIENICLASGFDVTVACYNPFRFGRDRLGGRFGRHGILTITMHGGKCMPFRFGMHRLGNRFRICNVDLLNCLLRRIISARYQYIILVEEAI